MAFLFCSSVFAIEENDSIPETKEKAPKEMFYGPSIGLGVGMFKFYGDILDANYGNPLVSNIGYDLHVKQQLNSFLTAKLYVLFGTLSANERSIDNVLKKFLSREVTCEPAVSVWESYVCDLTGGKVESSRAFWKG